MEENKNSVVKGFLIGVGTFFGQVWSYLLIIVAVVAIRIFIFDPVRVDGPSMENTLFDGEILILNKIEYKKEDIQRYDIVVVKVDGKKIIKRIIGLPLVSSLVPAGLPFLDGVLIENQSPQG